MTTETTEPMGTFAYAPSWHKLEPKPDITAYEVALLLVHADMQISISSFTALPDGLKRHFAVSAAPLTGTGAGQPAGEDA